MDYLESKLATYEQALNTFREALIKNPSQLERDGAIQRFEYSFDLAWKTLKRYLEKQGLIDLNSPRSVFGAAYAEGIIDDEMIWSTIILKRNASVHTITSNWQKACLPNCHCIMMQCNNYCKG